LIYLIPKKRWGIEEVQKSLRKASKDFISPVKSEVARRLGY